MTSFIIHGFIFSAGITVKFVSILIVFLKMVWSFIYFFFFGENIPARCDLSFVIVADFFAFRVFIYHFIH